MVLYVLIQWLNDPSDSGLDIVPSRHVVTHPTNLAEGEFVFARYRCSRIEARKGQIMKTSTSYDKLLKAQIKMELERKIKDKDRLKNELARFIAKRRRKKRPRSSIKRLGRQTREWLANLNRRLLGGPPSSDSEPPEITSADHPTTITTLEEPSTSTGRRGPTKRKSTCHTIDSGASVIPTKTFKKRSASSKNSSSLTEAVLTRTIELRSEPMISGSSSRPVQTHDQILDELQIPPKLLSESPTPGPSNRPVQTHDQIIDELQIPFELSSQYPIPGPSNRPVQTHHPFFDELQIPFELRSQSPTPGPSSRPDQAHDLFFDEIPYELFCVSPTAGSSSRSVHSRNQIYEDVTLPLEIFSVSPPPGSSDCPVQTHDPIFDELQSAAELCSEPPIQGSTDPPVHPPGDVKPPSDVIDDLLTSGEQQSGSSRGHSINPAPESQNIGELTIPSETRGATKRKSTSHPTDSGTCDVPTKTAKACKITKRRMAKRCSTDHNFVEEMMETSDPPLPTRPELLSLSTDLFDFENSMASTSAQPPSGPSRRQSSGSSNECIVVDDSSPPESTQPVNEPPKEVSGQSTEPVLLGYPPLQVTYNPESDRERPLSAPSRLTSSLRQLNISAEPRSGPSVIVSSRQEPTISGEPRSGPSVIVSSRQEPTISAEPQTGSRRTVSSPQDPMISTEPQSGPSGTVSGHQGEGSFRKQGQTLVCRRCLKRKARKDAAAVPKISNEPQSGPSRMVSGHQGKRGESGGFEFIWNLCKPFGKLKLGHTRYCLETQARQIATALAKKPERKSRPSKVVSSHQEPSISAEPESEPSRTETSRQERTVENYEIPAESQSGPSQVVSSHQEPSTSGEPASGPSREVNHPDRPADTANNEKTTIYDECSSSLKETSSESEDPIEVLLSDEPQSGPSQGVSSHQEPSTSGEPASGPSREVNHPDRPADTANNETTTIYDECSSSLKETSSSSEDPIEVLDQAKMVARLRMSPYVFRLFVYSLAARLLKLYFYKDLNKKTVEGYQTRTGQVTHQLKPNIVEAIAKFVAESFQLSEKLVLRFVKDVCCIFRKRHKKEIIEFERNTGQFDSTRSRYSSSSS